MNYKIEIPRDWRTSEIRFIDEMPLCLIDKLDKEIYKESINSINNIFKPKYSYLGIFKMLTLVPYLFSDKSSYDKDLDKVIENVNKKLKDKGMSFGNPKYENYTHLVLKIDE
ncbi:ERF4 domain-containing protein [Vairimorpha necatrix]|uniref:ERF4 domain-containing protein n=1 Tax=Vairimorpha necatrix TaxID=6039 RepID=A0AAX4J8E3_9MICR